MILKRSTKKVRTSTLKTACQFSSKKISRLDFYQKNTKKGKGLVASYEIWKIIAKVGKSHNIDETVILPVVPVVISTVMKQSAQVIINAIPQ